MSAPLKIGFLGAGKMATALAKGFIRAEIAFPKEISASDPHPGARKSFAGEVGAKTCVANLDVAKSANILILATKPDQVAAVLAEISSAFTKNHLLISIAAGLTLSKLESGLPAGARVIRVMPNTPALVGEGASAFALGKNATAADGELAKKLLSAVGLAFQVKESLLDAVTGFEWQRPCLRLSIHRGVERWRRCLWLATRHRHKARGANCFGRRKNGFGNRRTSRRAQGSSHQPRRHDD